MYIYIYILIYELAFLEAFSDVATSATSRETFRKNNSRSRNPQNMTEVNHLTGGKRQLKNLQKDSPLSV